MTNVINPSAFLRQQRKYSEEMPALLRDLDKTYVDVSNAVNVRTIGLFPTNSPAFTGEDWYFSNNERRQGLRQIFSIDSTASFDHNLDFTNSTFTKCSGSFTDGTNWYGMIFGSSVSIAGQISFYIDPTQIVIVPHGTSPTLTSGIIVIEWLSET